MSSDKTYLPKIHKGDGGDSMTVESGGYIDFLTGAQIRINGSDVTSSVSGAAVAGVAAGYKVARGVHQQAAAADTVVTGLATVVAVVVSWRDTPTLKQMFVTGSIGDQAGSPAAGSILIKTFKPTAANDVTPIAATDFTDNLSINWEAIGT
jgi:hypothetical protein